MCDLTVKNSVYPKLKFYHIMNLKSFSLMLLSLLAVTAAAGQQRIVSGRITDASTNQPIQGATVVIQGTTVGVSSDAQGNYSITVGKGETLLFDFLGMESQSVVVADDPTIDVAMKTDAIGLDDVVVVGYGIVKKRDLTGSIASVRSDQFLKSRPTSVGQSLQGRVAGVQVTRNDGAPGSGISIKIRGANSFYSGTEPLYVIDGIPLTTGSSTVSFGNDLSQNDGMSYLDPNDIESIEILKDGSSVAIYGSRGANGVVMITTKSGSKERSNLQLNMSMSINTIGKFMDVLGARDFANYQNEAYINLQKVNGVPVGDLPYRGDTPEDAQRILGGMAPEMYGNETNYWQKQLYRTAISKNVSLQYAGANETTDYMVSGSYLDQQGIIVNSGFTRYNFRANVNKKFKKWLQMGSSANFSTALNKRQMTSTKNQDLGVVNAALYYFPTYTRENAPSGSEFQMIANPYAYTQILNQNKTYNFYTTNYLNATLAKGLIFRTVLSYSMNHTTGNLYYPRTIPEGASYPGYAAVGNSDNEGITWDNLLMYNRSFGKHSINATLGTSWQSTHAYSVNTYNSGFGRDENNGWMIGDGTKLIKPTSYKADTEMFSYIFRAGYGYDNRYNLTLTMRRDASSVFAKNHKAAFFPSIGAGWTVTNEEFARDLKALTYLKVRYSYGQSGNAGIGAYGSLPNFVSSNAVIGDGTVSGYGPDFYNPGNPDLKWETTEQHDVGIELSLYDRVHLTADYYHKTTKDILQNLPQAASMGIVQVLSNIGNVRNTGYEFSVKADIFNTKDFSLNLFGNISFNDNEITKLNNNENDRIVPMEPFVLEKGHPIGQLYGYIEEGIWNTREEVIASAQFQKAYPGYKVSDNDPATEIEIRKSWVGEIRYKDLSGDNAITADDRTYIGDVNPDFTYGFGLNLNWKKLDFAALFDGVSGGLILNQRLVKFMNLGGYSNTLQSVLDNAWRPETGGTNPKIAYISSRPTYYSSRYLEDGSYLKLRSLSLGYTIDKPFKFIRSIRVYFVANNLFTITDYSGYDPEINSYGSNPIYRGVDMGAYPQSKEFTFGVNVTF